MGYLLLDILLIASADVLDQVWEEGVHYHLFLDKNIDVKFSFRLSIWRSWELNFVEQFLDRYFFLFLFRFFLLKANRLFHPAVKTEFGLIFKIHQLILREGNKLLRSLVSEVGGMGVWTWLHIAFLWFWNAVFSLYLLYFWTIFGGVGSICQLALGRLSYCYDWLSLDRRWSAFYSVILSSFVFLWLIFFFLRPVFLFLMS